MLLIFFLSCSLATQLPTKQGIKRLDNLRNRYELKIHYTQKLLSLVGVVGGKRIRILRAEFEVQLVKCRMISSLGYFYSRHTLGHPLKPFRTILLQSLHKEYKLGRCDYQPINSQTSAMAEGEPPLLLVFEPNFLLFDLFKQKYAGKFCFVNSWDYSPDLSKIPGVESIQAVVCNGKSPLSKEAMAKLPDLRMIANVSTGYNNIDLEECLRREISVSYAANVTAEDVGEMAVALLLDVLRKTVVADRFVRQGRWPVERECRLLGSKLGGKRVGIVGLGSIGTEIAKRLEPFGCRISYTSRAAKSSAPYTYVSNTGELASQSDILIICCALSDITYHLINRKVLLALGKGGVVINVGRGSIIDEKALVKCLMDGEIAGAGLDVFEGEPVVPKELMEMDNVVLSPHRAMYSDESFSDVCEIVLANLEAFFNNKPLISPVPVSS